MAVGDIIRITVNQTLQASVVQNVLYYKIEIEDSSGDDVQAVGNQFKLDVISMIWQDVVTAALSFDCLSLQKVFPDPIGAVQELGLAVLGLNTGESLPAMDAALIQKFNPAQGGVGKKGRVYIAGIAEEETAEGRIQPLLVATLDQLAAALEANLMVNVTGGEYEPVWVTRSTSAPFQITGFVENLTFATLPRVATQRRRRTPIRAQASA